MSIQDKIFYNEASSAKLGWKPEWLDHHSFDEILIRKIKAFQKAHSLTADGLLGPSTYRRLWTETQSNIDEEYEEVKSDGKQNYLLYNNEFFPVKWEKVVLPFDVGGLSHSNGNFRKVYEKRKIPMFVTHWDVCLNSRSCFKVLEKRGISIHFAIDNDGTIFQFLDMNHIAWHGSKGKINSSSVGVEIANSYYPKYQGWYTKRGFDKRPMVTDAKVHGKTLDPFMGFYPIQLKALKALMECVHRACGVELQTPPDKTVVPSVASGKYKGFVHHYQIVKTKIDCAGLDLQPIINDIKKGEI